MSYTPPIGDATATRKGLILLTGDLSGTAATPTVPALSTKANTTDVYTKSQVDSALTAKADASSLSSYIPVSQKGASSGVASLDGTGKVPSAQLPAASTPFNPIAGTNITITGTYPNMTFNATGSGGGGGVPTTYALGRVLYNSSWPSTRPSGYAYIDWMKSSPTDPDPASSVMVQGDTISEWQ